MRATVKVTGLARVRGAIAMEVLRHGSFAKAGAALGVSGALLCNVQRGHRLPTPALLEALRFERSVERVYAYRRVG